MAYSERPFVTSYYDVNQKVQKQQLSVLYTTTAKGLVSFHILMCKLKACYSIYFQTKASSLKALELCSTAGGTNCFFCVCDGFITSCVRKCSDYANPSPETAQIRSPADFLLWLLLWIGSTHTSAFTRTMGLFLGVLWHDIITVIIMNILAPLGMSPKSHGAGS